jgi:hypothetical protein
VGADASVLAPVPGALGAALPTLVLFPAASRPRGAGSTRSPSRALRMDRV